MLPKAWACIIFSKEIIGFALYIPWIFNGSYYDPMRNLKRFGWRIPKVLFEIRVRGRFRIIRRYYHRWYQTIIEVPKIQFNKFFWYEAI